MRVRKRGSFYQLPRSLKVVKSAIRLGAIPPIPCSGFRDSPISASRRTAVFSNVGVAFAGTKRLGADGRIRVGELVLNEIDAAAPVRPGTLAAFAALTYGKCLTICLSYDARLLSADPAADLLTLLTDGIQSSIS